MTPPDDFQDDRNIHLQGSNRTTSDKSDGSGASDRGMRLLLIGPRLGDTPTGVSQAFEDFICYVENHPGVSAKTVDMSLEACIQKTGGFNGRKAVYVLRRLVNVFSGLCRSDRAYLIISSSLLGFVKDFCVIWMCFLLRRPVALHLNGGGYKSFYSNQSSLTKAVIRVTLNRAASVIVLGDLLKSQFHFVRQEKIRIVPNGVEMTSATTIPRLPPREGEPWEFLYLSNLMETKGYLAVAETFLELIDSGHDNFVIHFCGNFLYSSIEGPEEVSSQAALRFQQILRMPQTDQRIVYHGNADPVFKQKMLKKCHSLILPTEYPGEGQPLCILEAMAFGLPVLATRHAGVPEQVVDGTTGYLMSGRTPAVIREAILKLTNPFETKFREMSSAGRNRFLTHFTVQTYRDRLLSVLGVPEKGTRNASKKAA